MPHHPAVSVVHGRFSIDERPEAITNIRGSPGRSAFASFSHCGASQSRNKLMPIPSQRLARQLCKALINQLTDQAHIITTGANSYGFRHTTAQRKASKT